eukprot:TRINITY_DN900_c0_g2_i2.p1 TRINITY_DN900_c0_g2~~TRINITY_DN900_c0_g2_i2.p1  ORF type:complete len:349 (+),score=80.36 TRINITY_DN900_c0_g2_i2:68-1048(+)
MMKSLMFATLAATASASCTTTGQARVWIDRANAGGGTTLKELEAESVSKDMPGWNLEGLDSRLWGVPDILSASSEARAFFPDQSDMILPGTQFKLKCPDDCSGKPCDFFIFMYHCPPCSRETNGRYTALLPSDGWETGSCAPRFSYVAEKYEMVGFRRQVAAGETIYTPPTEINLIHMGIFSLVRQPDCPGFGYSGCIGCAPICAWEEGKCQSNWCPRRFISGGNPPSCTKCVPNDFDDFTAPPTPEPTPVPTAIPTAVPTAIPTAVPTAVPTAIPTDVPTPTQRGCTYDDCYGNSCDYWVTKGYSCERLENKYGCRCDNCCCGRE